MTGFEGVVSTLARALAERNYATLTPVQQAILAPELAKADILVSAQTGSGKTVAFGIAIAPALLGDAAQFSQATVPLALVVAPTRELALQVKRELEWLYEMTGASIASCVGGMDMRDERRALQRGAHIVVGTPGRLRDHIERGSFDTTGLRAVVLDEADEMLDMGFRDDLELILDAAPNDRRTLMFSATVPRSIEALAKRYQRDAVRVTTKSDQKQHLDIEYRALTVAANDEENAIVNVLRYFDAKNALVFCATRVAVNHLTSRFNNRGFSVVALSGELSQNERTHALQAMRDGRARVCVATDVAARGLDLPDLELVIHADIPKTPETLLHRSGRTGRAGRKGVCTLIVPHNARKRTMRLLGSANINALWANPPTAEEIEARDHERLLTDPSLSAPMSDIEKTVARELLARHSAEQIAAAFVRLRFAEQAAPEELRDSGPPAQQPGTRDHFKNSVWFSLSVGRDGSAEPRWLLPMLCRVGRITKDDIGAIRVQASETYVELASASADAFLDALGPDAVLENNISVTRLDGAPDLQRDNRSKSNDRSDRSDRNVGSDRPRPAKKPYTTDKPTTRDDSKPKRTFIKKADEKPDGKKPWDKTTKKSKGKKSKPYAARAGSKSGGPDRAGQASLKRKKPKQHGKG